MFLWTAKKYTKNGTKNNKKAAKNVCEHRSSTLHLNCWLLSWFGIGTAADYWRWQQRPSDEPSAAPIAIPHYVKFKCQHQHHHHHYMQCECSHWKSTTAYRRAYSSVRKHRFRNLDCRVQSWGGERLVVPAVLFVIPLTRCGAFSPED